MAVRLHHSVNRARSVSAGPVDPMSNAFSVLVGGRSWDWLRELCRPLGVQAQLLDDSALPLLPPDTPSTDSPIALGSGCRINCCIADFPCGEALTAQYE